MQALADRPALCIRVCERQLDNADKLYIAGDSEKGQAALADVSHLRGDGARLCDSIAQASKSKARLPSAR